MNNRLEMVDNFLKKAHSLYRYENEIKVEDIEILFLELHFYKVFGYTDYEVKRIFDYLYSFEKKYIHLDELKEKFEKNYEKEKE